MNSARQIVDALVAREQRRSSQASERAQDREKRKRVPALIPMQRRMDALSSVRAGRSIYEAAREVPCAEVVVLEDWLRSQERQMRELGREIAAVRDELRRAA